MATVTPRPSPAPTVLRGVPYDVYVGLRDDRRNRGLRMTYHDGTLELMSPGFRHERGAVRLGMVVRAYAAVFQVPCQGVGTTTFRRGQAGRLQGYGKEPDGGFYLGASVDRVRHKDQLDLDVDPPPDLWIETDDRVSSAGRLPLYAGLGVPEVWRYRPRTGRLWFGRLQGGAYAEAGLSGCLPLLTPAVVGRLLEEADRRNETDWDLWMRGWLDGTLRHDGPDHLPA